MASESAIVVGAGGIAGAWFPPLKKEGVEVLAVVDLDLESAKKRLTDFECDAEPSADLAAMLEKYDADFVVDLTVPEAHCSVTCMALEAGCHVIGEKPMASSMDEARKMVETAQRTGKMYMVSQSRRWDVQHEVVQRTIHGGGVGTVTTINCDFYIGAHFGGFRDEMDSPLILDMSIHHFDLARFMTGVDPVAVYAREFNPKGSWYKGDVSASCIFEMTNDVVFTYRGSWCSEGCHTSWNGDWRIIGDRGTLLYEAAERPHGQVVAGDEGFNRPLEDLAVAEPQVEFTGMHGALQEMLDFLRTGKQPQTHCADNIKSLAMVFGAMESAKRGERVEIG